MYSINIETLIKAGKDIVFSVIKDMANFPNFMSDVKSLKVKKTGNNEMISRWSIEIEGAEVVWEEKDVYNEELMEIYFSKITGDYNVYHGKWSVQNAGNKTRLSFELTVDCGIPSFEKIVGHVLVQKTRRAIQGMLTAVKAHSEKMAKIRG